MSKTIKLKNKEIIYLLETAKTLYINNKHYTGMCSAISSAYSKIYNNGFYYDIKYIIPKFNTEFLNAVCGKYGFWWLMYDRKSRIKAFDKLIKYYKHNAISYRIKFYIKLYYHKCSKIIK